MRQPTGQQVRNHLRIGLGEEVHALRLQLLAQAAVVFDDAVLHHRQPATAVEMGVGIALLRLAMGGPARMADTAVARSPVLLVTSREVDQLAFRLEAMEPGGIHRGDTRRVVAAVFELPQTLQQLGRGLTRTDQGNDAAHRDGSAEGGHKKARQGPGMSLWEPHTSGAAAGQRQLSAQ